MTTDYLMGHTVMQLVNILHQYVNHITDKDIKYIKTLFCFCVTVRLITDASKGRHITWAWGTSN